MLYVKRLTFLSFILLFIFAFSPTQPNAAELEDMPPLPATGTPSSDINIGTTETELEEHSEHIQNIEPFANTKYLRNGTSMIQGDGQKVRIRGTTQAFQNVSSISANVTLEYWSQSKNKWVSVPGTNQTNYYAKSVIATANFTVSKGFYYRTRTDHRVSHAGKVETRTTRSTYIYVK